jgi:prepilin-type N-terminal cleavage/methylation domain-containing protein
MKTPASRYRVSGFSLVELMIALAVGLLISAAAISAFLGHTGAVYQQMGYNQASEDVGEAYAVLSRLITQAHQDTLDVATTEVDDVITSTTIDLELPEGFSVWPNTTAPYSNNWVRIAWASTGDGAGTITIASASDSGDLAAAPSETLAGSADTARFNTTRITSLILESDELLPEMYIFSISGKSFARDRVDGDDDSKGVSIEGRILPRNCHSCLL